MSIPFPQPYSGQPVPNVSPNVPTLNHSPVSIDSHLSPNLILNSSYGTHQHHSHRHSRSSSLVPSPVLPPAHLSLPGPAQIEQGHHYRPRTHSHSSDHRHRHHPHPSHQSGQSRSHSYSHSHSRHGSRSVTPAPPLLIQQHSEPVGPYVSVPTFPYPATGYQPPQSAYGPTLTPAAAPVPMPVPSLTPIGVPHGFSPSQYPSLTGVPPEPAVQNRAVHVSRYPRSHARKPLVSQEIDAPDPTRGPRCHPLFRQSRCSGRRKAVCVGINYSGQQHTLQGCVDDARRMYQFLMAQYRYPHSNIIVLTDDNPNPRSQPTRMNLLNAMRWLVEDAHPDDALFIHYSGHGGRTRDHDGDESDGFDEVIFPLDYRTTGIITDDLLHETLVKPLPAGCRLTAVFDSCHSGSILDLNFEFHSNGRLKSSPVAPAFQQAKATPADVVCFSGCKDTQTSADVVQGGVAIGAMSYALLKVLKRNPQITYIDLLRGVRSHSEILRKKYSQKPQLSASQPLNAMLNFIM
ncbi:caspase domain-containing protein [Russula earlei]|uniref:Caspase domain-containing protein n=1 Tax=Russula earlei TaxID=71964 RepID=A0ACC0U0C5_9AGAM|nr:caspase domain-containing protein [Russula earlei]